MLGTCRLNRPPVLIHSDPGTVSVRTDMTNGVWGSVSGDWLPTERSAGGVTIYTGAAGVGLIGLQIPVTVLCKNIRRPKQRQDDKDNAHDKLLTIAPQTSAPTV
jgi:hypothetical protein